MALDLAKLRERYQDGYQPVCGGCGQLMRCILWRVFKCDGKVKVNRRWQDCPAPEQWERPSPQQRQEVLALLDLLDSSAGGIQPDVLSNRPLGVDHCGDPGRAPRSELHEDSVSCYVPRCARHRLHPHGQPYR